MKRVKLSLSGKRGLLCVERLVPIVIAVPQTGNIIEYSDTGEAVETGDVLSPAHLNRGYGFGSFLLSLSADEIVFDQKVLDFLTPCVNRKYSSMGDLFGFSLSGPNPESRTEGFVNNHLAYASLSENLMFIPAADCQIDYVVYHEMQEELLKSQWGML